MAPVFFWKESDHETGWLCQWYYHPFRDDEVLGTLYHTAEHYMMYQKAKLFGDDETAAEILQTKSPRKAKTLGRKVANFDQTTWEAKREAVALKGNLLKFSAPAPAGPAADPPEQPAVEPSLHEKLLHTGSRELIEASPFDRMWGIGFRSEEARRTDPNGD